MDNLYGQLTLRLKSVFDKKPNNKSLQSHPPPGLESKYFRLWNWALPLLLGLTVGWLGMVCLEIWLEGRNVRVRPAIVDAPAVYLQDNGTNNFAAFLRTNPFGITPRPTSYTVPIYIPQIQIVNALDSAILTGTSPGHMAWMTTYQGALRLVPVGGQFDAYTLVDVTRLNATFANGDDRVVKTLFFGLQPAPSQAIQRFSEAGTQNIDLATLPAPATPAPIIGTSGQISRALLNSLLENPFGVSEEIHLRPADGGQGLYVVWVTADSVFAMLGVQQGDVLSAINGITFRNAMDIINSLDLLIHNDQFVVEVKRDGVAILLRYAVR